MTVTLSNSSHTKINVCHLDIVCRLVRLDRRTIYTICTMSFGDTAIDISSNECDRKTTHTHTKQINQHDSPDRELCSKSLIHSIHRKLLTNIRTLLYPYKKKNASQSPEKTQTIFHSFSSCANAPSSTSPLNVKEILSRIMQKRFLVDRINDNSEIYNNHKLCAHTHSNTRREHAYSVFTCTLDEIFIKYSKSFRLFHYSRYINYICMVDSFLHSL